MKNIFTTKSERRFIAESEGTKVGLVELVEIDYVHRRAEFQKSLSPCSSRPWLCSPRQKLAMDYAFLYLIYTSSI